MTSLAESRRGVLAYRIWLDQSLMHLETLQLLVQRDAIPGASELLDDIDDVANSATALQALVRSRRNFT